jgi:hypothetical protein
MIILIVKGDDRIYEFFTGASLRRFIRLTKLQQGDFTLIEGTILKSLDNKTLTQKGKALCRV